MKDTLEQVDLTDIHKTFHPNIAEYSLFSSAQRTYYRIDDMLSNTSLNKMRRTEIIPGIFSNNSMKLDIDNRGKN